MSACISEPLSYLQLERHSLGELSAVEKERVNQHLERCPACRACYERIRADDRAPQLAALAAHLDAVKTGLPLPASRRSRRRPATWAALALSAALAIFVVVQPEQRSATSPDLEPPSSSKGTALALEVIRMNQRGEQLDATHFAASDRFKLLVTCPEGHERALRVLAFQAGQVFEPVPPQELASCGNRRALRGAWQLDGSDPVDLCVVFGHADLEDVHVAEALPEPHVCAHLQSADASR